MNDPISTLKQFVPNGPNRDDLLVAVGRATTRPNRVWKLATAVLAVSQLLTLVVLFWPAAENATPSARLTAPLVPPVVEPAAPPEPEVSPPTLDPHSYLALNFSETAEMPAQKAVPPLTRVERPLRAGSRQYD